MIYVWKNSTNTILSFLACFHLKRSFISLFVFFLFILAAAQPVFGDLEFSTTTTPLSIIPQGTSDADVIYFEMKAPTVPDDVKSVHFQVSNETDLFFGANKIKSAYIYKDSDENRSFSKDSDTLLAKYDFTVDTTSYSLAFAAETVSVGDPVGFFLVFDIDKNAVIESSADINITNVFNSSNTAATGTKPTNPNLTISGLKGQVSTALAPTYIIPGQKKVEMLILSFKVVEEDMDRNDISFTIKNNAENFINNEEESNTGVEAVYLFEDVNGNSTYDSGDLELIKITSSEMESNSEITFDNFQFNTMKLEDGVTKSFFVLYDIAQESEIENDSRVNCQLTAFSGSGSRSGRALSLTSPVPIVPAESILAGLKYSGVEGITTKNSSVYGLGDSIPMTKFDLIGQNVTVNLTKIELHNSGNVPFVTLPNKTDGIVSIQVYSDTNLNGEYDGENIGDTLVGSLELGYGATGQTADFAPIPITANNITGVVIPATTEETEDADLVTHKTFFVVYQVGEGINLEDYRTSTDNIDAKINCFLLDAKATSNISAQLLSLSGALPATPNPLAEITLSDANLTLVEITDISSTTVLRGQTKAPMLAIKFDALTDLPGVSMRLYNNKSSFNNNNNKGVTKVWVFSEVDAVNGIPQVLDDTDELLSSETNFNEPSKTYLPKFDLDQGENNLLVCYDIGFDVPTTQVEIRCQLLDVISTGNSTNVELGGELPQPKVAAEVIAEEKILSIDKVTASNNGGIVYNTSAPFTVQVTVQNHSSSTVTLNNVIPRFYFEDVKGPDISYEFDISSESTIEPLLGNGTGLYTFQVEASRLISVGTIYVDAQVSYTQNTRTGLVQRYQKLADQWVLAAAESAKFYAQSLKNSELIPDYIESIKVEIGSGQMSFANYDAVPANSSMIINFVNNGAFFDEGSLKIHMIKGASQELEVDPMIPTGGVLLTTKQYEYNRNTGVLRIEELGEVDSVLLIKLNDLDNNPLQDTFIQYYISEDLRVNNFYTYPNPYAIGQDMQLGFNITQPAFVTIYFYNALGVEIHRIEDSFPNLGYKLMTWNGVLSSGEYIASGIYIALLVAQGNDGSLQWTKTKMAVY